MVPVDQVININDPSILWFRIQGFPGYEICKDKYLVRSFKSRKKYPYGTLVKWNNNNITLTNSNNQRVKLTLQQLLELADTTPCKTYEVQNTSRNPLCGIDTNEIPEVGRVISKPKVQTSAEHQFVDFSNIPDIDLNDFV